MTHPPHNLTDYGEAMREHLERDAERKERAAKYRAGIERSLKRAEAWTRWLRRRISDSGDPMSVVRDVDRACESLRAAETCYQMLGQSGPEHSTEGVT